MWGSLASRVFRKHEIVGSNPTILTNLMRWVPCWYGRAAVNRFVAGSIPASAAFAKRKGKPIGDGSRFESGRAISLESSTLSPSAYNNVLLAERQRLQASNLARRVRLSQSTLGDRLTAGRLPLKQAVKVRILLPKLANPSVESVSYVKQIDAG